MTHDEAVKKLEGMVRYRIEPEFEDKFLLREDGADIARHGATECEMLLWNTCLSLLRRQEWVKVSEKLPEDGTSALVYVPGATDAYLRNRVAWIDHDAAPPEWISDGDVVQSVTHWQPLPSPPEEENDGTN